MPPDEIIAPVDLSSEDDFGLLAGLSGDRSDQFRVEGL
jgi:hypothetical protein